MNRTRLLSLVALGCAAAVFTYGRMTGFDPRAHACLTTNDNAMTLCNEAYASKHLTDEERGLVAFRLGYLNDVAGDWEPAIAYYTTSIDLFPQKAAAFLNRGVLLRRHDINLNAAIDDFSTYITSGEDDATGLVQRARAYRELGEFALATADLDDAAAIAPQTLSVLSERAQLLQDQDDDAAALAVLEDAITHHPDSLWLRRERSWVKRQLSDYDGAMQDIVHAIATDPDHAWSWYQRGWLNAQMQNYVQAITDLQTALAKNPSYRPAQRQMRHLMQNIGQNLQGQPERLHAFADAGLANDPDNTELIYLRVLAQQQEGKFLGAINDVNRLIAMADYPQTLIFLRSSIHLAAHQYDQALADLESLTSDPSAHDAAIEALARKADELHRQGNHTEAAARDADIGALAALYAEAMRARVAIYRAQGDFGALLAAIEELAAYDPDDSHHWVERGRVLEQLGRTGEALESYDKAIQLVETGGGAIENNSSDHANALLRRGALHQAAQRPELAQADFAAALGLGNADIIRAFQHKMKLVGHYDGPLNGLFDTVTQAALADCAADLGC